MKPLTHEDYIRWLKAAYLYYYEPEKNTGMSDQEWDALALAFYRQRDRFPAVRYPILHDHKWGGGSLYWLSVNDYPDEVLGR